MQTEISLVSDASISSFRPQHLTEEISPYPPLPVISTLSGKMNLQICSYMIYHVPSFLCSAVHTAILLYFIPSRCVSNCHYLHSPAPALLREQQERKDNEGEAEGHPADQAGSKTDSASFQESGHSHGKISLSLSRST